MSDQQHLDANHARYREPIFIKELVELQLLFDQNSSISSKFCIHNALRSMKGFKKIKPFKTSDGYNWFAGIEFKTHNKNVIIAMPWAQDFDRSGGTQSDRAFAIYATKVTKNQIIVDIVNLSIINLKKYIDNNRII